MSADEPETYNPALVPPGALGFHNTGVICHKNGLLQALVSCSAVVRAAFGHRGYLARTATGRAFYDFVHAAVPAGRPPGAEPFGPPVEYERHSAAVLRALVEDLRARRPTTRYGPSQESASEGLVLLLDMIDDPNPAPVGTELDAETGREVVVYEENPIARLFYHRYEARIYCKGCEAAVSEKLDVAVQFNLFQYDFLGRKPKTPAEFGEMLRSQVSSLEDYRCEKCGEKAGGLRHYRLRMVPEVLVCVFNLYDDSVVRVSRFFPTRVPFPGIKGSQMIFRQVAQVEQTGSRAGGHYTARALRGDGRVYHFDDTAASPSAFGPTPNVYLVFYHCEHSPSSPPVARKAPPAHRD